MQKVNRPVKPICSFTELRAWIAENGWDDRSHLQKHPPQRLRNYYERKGRRQDGKDGVNGLGGQILIECHANFGDKVRVTKGHKGPVLMSRAKLDKYIQQLRKNNYLIDRAGDVIVARDPNRL